MIPAASMSSQRTYSWMRYRLMGALPGKVYAPRSATETAIALSAGVSEAPEGELV